MMVDKDRTHKIDTCDCRHVGHIKESTKTEGTNYKKGWCTKCHSWVFTEKKSFCICCMRRVKHKVHFLRCKRIYNKAMKEYPDQIELYSKSNKKIPELHVEVKFDDAKYHIPLPALIRYATNGYTRETMIELQDAIRRVKNYHSREGLP